MKTKVPIIKLQLGRTFLVCGTIPMLARACAVALCTFASLVEHSYDSLTTPMIVTFVVLLES